MTALQQRLGGKGANLAEMASLGLPVPAGFTLTTEVCSCALGLLVDVFLWVERLEAQMLVECFCWFKSVLKFCD